MIHCEASLENLSPIVHGKGTTLTVLSCMGHDVCLSCKAEQALLVIGKLLILVWCVELDAP